MTGLVPRHRPGVWPLVANGAEHTQVLMLMSLCAKWLLPHTFFTSLLGGRHYYPQLTEEETGLEGRRASDQMVRTRWGLEAGFALPPEPMLCPAYAASKVPPEPAVL